MKELCPDHGSSAPVPPDFRALCAELVDELHAYKVGHPSHDTDLLDRARAALALPVPPAPTQDELFQEILKLPTWKGMPVETFRNIGAWELDALDIEEIARAVLARWGNTTPGDNQ